MRLALNLCLTLISLFTFDNESISLTNEQINQICKKERRTLTCRKNLKEKRNNLQKGNLIEIPVIPYRR